MTALGKVISALVAEKKQHVPYRDSKLTKLLSDSLGGNSKTVMIANVGPAEENYEETLTTIRYANRAKDIKNAPKINEDPKDAMIRQYQDELANLKKQLLEQGNSLDPGLTIPGENGEMIIVSNNSKKKIEDMENQLKKEKENILSLVESEKKKIEEQKNLAEDEKLKLLEKLKVKQEEQDKQNRNKEKLLHKLKALEEKFVIGEENEKIAKQNEEIINKTKFELEEKERLRIKLQQEIEKENEEKTNLKLKYDDKQIEIEKKTEIFNKLKEKLQELEAEKQDLEKDFNSGIDEMEEMKNQIEKENNFKDVVKDSF